MRSQDAQVRTPRFVSLPSNLLRPLSIISAPSYHANPRSTSIDRTRPFFERWVLARVTCLPEGSKTSQAHRVPTRLSTDKYLHIHHGLRPISPCIPTQNLSMPPRQTHQQSRSRTPRRVPGPAGRPKAQIEIENRAPELLGGGGTVTGLEGRVSKSGTRRYVCT